MNILQESNTARFHKFHLENKHVYKTLVKMCRQWRYQHGQEAKISIKTLWEVMRWQYAMGISKSDEPFKLNNIFTSHYARLIMDCNADLDGIFNLREMKAI